MALPLPFSSAQLRIEPATRTENEPSHRTDLRGKSDAGAVHVLATHLLGWAGEVATATSDPGGIIETRLDVVSYRCARSSSSPFAREETTNYLSFFNGGIMKCEFTVRTVRV